MTNPKHREFDLIPYFGGESPRPTINPTATTAGGSHVPSSPAEVRLGITRHFLRAPWRGTLRGGPEPNGQRGSAAPTPRGAPSPPPLRSQPGLDSDGPPCCWSAARPGPGPARTAGRAGGSARSGGRAKTGNPLGRRPPCAGVVTGVRVVTVVGTVVLAVLVFGESGIAVTVGSGLGFAAAVSTHSAARQAAAQGSWRESPDITSPALVFGRKLRRTLLRPSLCPLRHRLGESGPPRERAGVT